MATWTFRHLTFCPAFVHWFFRPKKRSSDHIRITLKKCNIQLSDLEASASDRDVWRTVYEADLNNLMNGWINTGDCNPGIDFSIPGFGIGKISIPGSRPDWRNIVWAYTTTAYGH